MWISLQVTKQVEKGEWPGEASRRIPSMQDKMYNMQKLLFLAFAPLNFLCKILSTFSLLKLFLKTTGCSGM